MRKLYFAILQYFNDGEPSREEVQYLLRDHYQFKAKMSQNERRRALILNYYTMGHSLQDLAKEFNVTRERIRQIIRKSVRDANSKA